MISASKRELVMRNQLNAIQIRWQRRAKKLKLKPKLKKEKGIIIEKAIESKRMFWSDAEITELLGLVKENNILGKLDGKTKRSNLAYRGLAESVKSKNMIKSGYQIKTKLRMLKKTYFEVKRSNAVSGIARRTCTYFESSMRCMGLAQCLRLYVWAHRRRDLWKSMASLTWPMKSSPKQRRLIKPVLPRQSSCR